MSDRRVELPHSMTANTVLPGRMSEFIATVYEPLARRIAREVRSTRLPFVVGLCGPQGSGKTTIAQVLQKLLQQIALATEVLSLDDLYLTRDERSAVAQRVHPLLRTRGVPGTHDAALGLQLLEALGRDEAVSIPTFDKATDERRPAPQWRQSRGPVQVVLFEGWCVGAQPEPAALLVEPVNELERDLDPDGRWRRYVNKALATEYRALFDRLNFLVLLRAPQFDAVYAWRAEQEHELRQRVEARGGDTSRLMSDAELRHFIAHYERLTKHILKEMPSRADAVIELDASRSSRLLLKDSG